MRASSFIPGLVAVTWLCTASVVCHAGENGLKDEGGMASAATIAKVDAIAKEIEQTTHYDLLIKTFDTVPDQFRVRLNTEDKNKVYDDWLVQEARAGNVKGVFILIVKSPGHVQIGVGNQTQTKAFTLANRDTLRDQILAAFKQKQFDAGMVDAAVFVQKTIAANLGQAPTTTPTEGPVVRPTSGPSSP